MSNDTKANDWKKREVGALWRKESATQKYFSGHVKIDDYGEEKLLKVVVLKNNYKEKDNHPDFRIYTVDDTPKKPKEEKVEDSSVVGEVPAEELL